MATSLKWLWNEIRFWAAGFAGAFADGLGEYEIFDTDRKRSLTELHRKNERFKKMMEIV